MGLYQNIVAKAAANREIRLAGGYTCFPWLDMPKISTILPGIQKGRYVIVTANSKVGKTQITDHLYLLNPLDFLQKNPTSGLKLKIFYFSLEMSAEDKLKSVVSNKLFKDHNISTSPDKLYSEYKNDIIAENVLQKLSSYEEYFNWFSQHVEIIDNIRNPYGIYKYVRQYAIANGTFYLNGRIVDMSNPSNKIYDEYKANDPDEYVIIITDHVSLLQPENGKSLWDAIFSYSSNYCLKMRDNFKYTVVNVQQQAADQEKQQFTFKGSSIINKIKPSPDGLGDCKLSGRDCDVMLGLFAPARYNIAQYPAEEGYDLTKLGDSFRELSILLNRRGISGRTIPLYFRGDTNFFKELPSPTTINYQNYICQ